MIIDDTNRDLLSGYVSLLHSYVHTEIYQPILERFPNAMPKDVLQLYQDVNGLLELLRTRKAATVPAGSLPYMKLALQLARRRKVEKQELLKPKTHHHKILQNIDQMMEPIANFMKSDWYSKTDTFALPALTDYLTLQQAYGALPGRSHLNQQPLDDKFGILYAQKAFIPSLQHARIQAQFRNIESTVAFVDIDNFKSFNTTFGEPLVDEQFLPKVMQAIEAHVYSHGMAFRFGGDEYVLLLQNMNHSFSLAYLNDLQKRLASISIPNITDSITVSIGCTRFRADSFLTDNEILQNANKAMRYAKSWRDCVAYYKGNAIDETNLEVVTSAGNLPREMDRLKTDSAKA